MRPLTLAGLVLVCSGLFVAIRGVSYRTDRSVFKLGDIEARVEEERTIPTWAGAIGLAAGILLILADRRRS
jgi:hypothetical protein